MTGIPIVRLDRVCKDYREGELSRHVLRETSAALPEGDRALPQAGLLFFEYRGKTQGIRSIELIYDGPAGKATLKLQP